MTLSVLDHWFGAPPSDENRDDRHHVRRGDGYGEGVSASHRTLSAADAVFLEQLRSEDVVVAEHALAELHRTWAASLARYVERLVHSADVADDIVQEVFVSVWTRRTQLLSAGSVRAYLFGAVHRRALQWMRNARVAEQWAERVAGEIAASPAIVCSTDSGVEIGELAHMLRSAIAELAPRQREALLLYRERELSLAEVAEVMEISVNTVKVQLQRAGTTLREAVERYLRG